MRRFFTEQKKELTEMAAPKLPEGVKRTRSKVYQSVHDIHVDGEHVATISGYKPSARAGSYGTKWAPGTSNQFGKAYTIHPAGEHSDVLNKPHPDHSYTSPNELVGHHPMRDQHGKPIENSWGGHTPDYDKPIRKDVQRGFHHGSMESAVDAIVHTHRNNNEFGKGHDPKVRWQKAIDNASGADAHKERTNQYNVAINHAKSLGHEDIVTSLEHHRDAHIAKKPEVSTDKLHQWTHDAAAYTSKSYKRNEQGTQDYLPDHPEHHDLAVKAVNVRIHGHPDGPSWNRKRSPSLHN